MITETGTDFDFKHCVLTEVYAWKHPKCGHVTVPMSDDWRGYMERNHPCACDDCVCEHLKAECRVLTNRFERWMANAANVATRNRRPSGVQTRCAG